MEARRRRGTSECEEVPLVVKGGAAHTAKSNAYYQQSYSKDSYQHHPNGSGGHLEESYDLSAVGDVHVPLPDPIMTSRDRTNEFKSVVRSLQGRQVMRAAQVRDVRRATNTQSYAEFMMIARTIARNYSDTCSKLEKLTMLAKRKSLFNDRPTEIQDLTYIIKEDINSLNGQIGRLQEVARGQQRSHQTREHLLKHSSGVVLSLQSRLANMSSDFKQVLEVRTENLKQQKNRRDQFSMGPVASSLPPSALSGHHQGSVLLAEEQVAIDLEPSESSALLPVSQKQAMVYDETDNYLQNRAETMQNIESTIVELGGIFQQLAHMVKEQEEMVERIDSNVEDAEMNVESAHGEILKYFQSVTSNRWLMIKIFAVLIFFFIFFVVFLA